MQCITTVCLFSYRWQLQYQDSRRHIMPASAVEVYLAQIHCLGTLAHQKTCVAILLVYHSWLFTLFLIDKVHGTLLSTMDACSYIQPWPYLYLGRRHVEAIYSNSISCPVYWWPKILESNNILSITILIIT